MTPPSAAKANEWARLARENVFQRSLGETRQPHPASPRQKRRPPAARGLIRNNPPGRSRFETALLARADDGRRRQIRASRCVADDVASSATGRGTRDAPPQSNREGANTSPHRNSPRAGRARCQGHDGPPGRKRSAPGPAVARCRENCAREIAPPSRRETPRRHTRGRFPNEPRAEKLAPDRPARSNLRESVQSRTLAKNRRSLHPPKGRRAEVAGGIIGLVDHS